MTLINGSLLLKLVLGSNVEVKDGMVVPLVLNLHAISDQNGILNVGQIVRLIGIVQRIQQVKDNYKYN